MKELVKLLRRHEGVMPRAYQDTEGVWTIGVGRNINPENGLGLSDDEIDLLLTNDLSRCESEAYDNFQWFADLDEARQDGILNMIFNLGISRFKGFKKAIAAMEEKDYETAHTEFMDSKWSRQVGQRAIEVTNMIRSGTYPE
jgi:lysozyme